MIWLIVVVPLAAVALSGLFFAAALPGCTSCHDQGTFVSATRSSSHSEVKCASCHVSSGLTARVGFGYRQAFHMELPLVSGQGQDWASVPDDRCLKCHDKVNESVVEAKGLRINHELCSRGAACTECHSTVAHGKATKWVRVYDMDTCLECHSSEQSAKCDLCHMGRSPADRITSGVFAITHGPQWKQTHGMGNAATCSACHTAASCEKCHGPGLPHGASFVAKHSTVAKSPKAKCSSCHQQSFCGDCHGLTMPHSRQFIRGHAKPAKAKPQLCKRCHAEPDCTKCHESHVHPGGAVGSNTPLLPWKAGER